MRRFRKLFLHRVPFGHHPRLPLLFLLLLFLALVFLFVHEPPNIVRAEAGLRTQHAIRVDAPLPRGAGKPVPRTKTCSCTWKILRWNCRAQQLACKFFILSRKNHRARPFAESVDEVAQPIAAEKAAGADRKEQYVRLLPQSGGEAQPRLLLAV